MPAASRVQVVPPAPWSEQLLVAAARALKPTGQPVRPGDNLGELVVIGVEPAAGAALVDETEIEIVATPRRRDAPIVDVAVLLDVSESMGIPWDAKHTRMQAALTTLAGFLVKPGEAVGNVSVYEYAKDARRVLGPAPASEIHLGEPPVAKGPSGTGTALNAALADLASQTSADRSQIIFLFTDGVGELTELLIAAERAGRLHVPVHALVFAPEVDEVFEDLAHVSGGSVQTAAYPLTIEFEHQPGG